MNNTWCCMAACVFFCMAASAFAASVQEADFVRVALEQLRNRMERDDKGTLDEFVVEISTASGLSAGASRDSLVSLLRQLKTHCKKSTALGAQLFALHGEHFSKRMAQAYLVRVVDMAGDLLEKEENVGLEPLMAKAAGKSKLLKFQALDYTAALLVPFVGSPVVEEPVEEEGAVNALPGTFTFKVLVRTRNSEGLPSHVDNLVLMHAQESGDTFFRVFKVSPLELRAKKKVLALHESVRPALLDELKQFSHVRFTTDPSAKDIRYILDYVAEGYSVSRDRDQRQFRRLGTDALLTIKDVLGDKEILNKWLGINTAFEMDEEPMLDEFYREVARTAAQEVFSCLIENARLRR